MPPDVEDQVGLEELRARVDLLLFAQCLEFRVGRKGGGCCAQENLRRKFDLAPIQVLALIAHAAQDPKHLHRIEVVDLHLLAWGRGEPCAVAADAQDVADTERGRADHFALEIAARTIARRDLQDGFSAMCHRDLTAGPGGHARRGRGIVCKVDGRDVMFGRLDVLDQLVGFAWIAEA